MKTSASKYIAAFLGVPLACFVGLLVLIFVFHNDLPAPHVSNSVSFNEKARWMRNNIDGKCDIFVVGSSMALNNINSDELTGLYPKERIVNAASWGMGIEETLSMLQNTTSFCKPKVIILLTNYVDFVSAPDKKISWDQFDDYLRGGSIELAYLRGFELYSFMSDIKSFRLRGSKGRKYYESLDFDNTGSVNFDVEGFEINPRRWDGYKEKSSRHATFRPQAVEAMSSIVQIANKNGSELVVVVTPMRKVAELNFYPNVRSDLWRRVEKITQEGQAIFIRVPERNDFDDSLFVDYNHLNKMGSIKLTQLITEKIRANSGGYRGL